MTVNLPDGEYPFIDQRLPLSELSMIEVPPDLEGLLKDQAAKNGVAIIRNEPVELRCQTTEFGHACFLIVNQHRKLTHGQIGSKRMVLQVNS